jgi:tetratricopeptide (TPR) repeat protein
MSTLRGLKQRLSTVSRLWDEQDYDQALAEVQSLLKTWPGNPHLHVLKASLVQLQEEPNYDLDEARKALHQAIELDRASPAASIELGHFLDNVADDPRSAIKAYAEGVAAARHLLIDGLIGQAKAYRQLDKNDDFLRCLLEALELARFDSASRRNQTEDFGTDIFVKLDSGRVYVIQQKGPYAEQVRELLSELDANHLAEPGAAPGRGRKAGAGRKTAPMPSLMKLFKLLSQG